MKLNNKEIQTKINNSIIIIILISITFLVSLTLRSNPFSQFLPNHDSSMFQYFGYAMNNGKTMYTEIFDHKGPMIFIINYIGVLLSTSYVQGIYWIEFISLFIYFVFSFKTLNLWLNKLSSVILVIPQAIVLMFFLEGGNLTEEFALPFIAISLFIFSKYFINPKEVSYLEVVFLGGAFAIVFSLRANMVVIWLVFCLAIFLESMVSKKYKELLKYSTFFILGMLLFFLPVSIYLFLNEALEASVFQSLTFNFMYLDGTESKSEAIMQLYTRLNNNFIIIINSIFLMFVVSTWGESEKRKKYFNLALITFSIGSYLTSTMSGRDYPHYLMAMVPTMTVPTGKLVDALVNKNNKYHVGIAALISISLIYYPHLDKKYKDVYVLNTPLEKVNAEKLAQSIEESEQSELQQLYLKIFNNENQKKRINEVANFIKDNTNPTDKIYVHRQAGNLYLLSERLSSIKYFNLPAVNINENQMIGLDFLHEIKNSNTKLIVLPDAYNGAHKSGIDAAFFDYINDNFKLINNENGFHIYKKK